MSYKTSKKNLTELRASKELDADILELQKMLKPKKEPTRKGEFFRLTIPKGVDPKEAIKQFEQEHNIGERDTIFIQNYSGVPLDDSKRKERPAHKAAFDNDHADDLVIQDLGEPTKPKPVLKEMGHVEPPQAAIMPRPKRLEGRSYHEILLMEQDGALNKTELRWLHSKTLPGRMPNLKYRSGQS